MKKCSLILLCCIWLITHATAQVGYAPEIGANFSNMQFTPPYYFQAASTQGLTRPRIGGIIDLDMGTHIYIQPGIFFSGKGAKRNLSYAYHDTSEAINETLALNYLEIPINVLYKTGHQGDNRFFFGLGVDFEQLLGGKDKINAILDTGTGQTFPLNITDKVSDAVESFDIGMNFIVGFEFSMGVYIKASYTLGVKDISLDSAEGEVDKNYSASLSAGYFFGKNRHKKRVVAPIEE
jgi:hypothetical protein